MAIFLACAEGLLTVVQMMQTAPDLDINRAEPTFGTTPLFVACQNGCLPVVLSLMSHSQLDITQTTRNPNPYDLSFRLTPLDIARANDLHYIMKALTEHHAHLREQAKPLIDRQRKA